ncbi:MULTISPECIES: GTPase Era [unclassified Corynebacterium]|uniref:GTPase Era n=1 Tax=unclassified Corynebacterium TaxID=2624378 RepID=UPI0030A4F1BD
MGGSADDYSAPEGFRSGFVSIVGRPNTGKSTLTNALVGEKIAITADQPETTRHVVRGVVHRPECQIVVVDTPGLHKPRKLIGQRLNDMVAEAYADVDLIALAVPADEKIGPGDRWILDSVKEACPNTPLMGIVTKVDKASRDQVMERLLELHALLGDVELVPVSATSGENLETLAKVIGSQLPEGPKLYPDGHVTDEDQRTRMAELIREAALGGLRDELPHSVAVEIDEILPSDRPNCTDVHAVIYVERPGQKMILQGRDGRRLKSTIQKARKELIELMGTNVFLDLRIKVLKDWQSDPKQLGRLGF